MEIEAKQRLIGAMVFLAIVAIFLSLLFHNPYPSTNLSMTTTTPLTPLLDKPVVQLRLLPSVPKINSIDLQVKQVITPSTLPVLASAPIQSKNLVQKRTSYYIKSLFSKIPIAWMIQVASFENYYNAKRLLQRLQEKGFDAYLEKTHEDKIITRVFIGPEINRNKLNKIQEELKKKIRLNGIIKKYQLRRSSGNYPVLSQFQILTLNTSFLAFAGMTYLK